MTTLITAAKETIELHSKGRFKICTFSVILGYSNLNLFEIKLKGLQYYFPENF